MKSIQDIKNKFDEMDSKYNEINTQKDKNTTEKEEKLIIYGHWVDFTSDLLDWNILDFLEKNGYDLDNLDPSFKVTKEIEKQIVITEEQIKKEIELREKFIKEHPYGLINNGFYPKGIYLEKLELDILKWALED